MLTEAAAKAYGLGLNDLIHNVRPSFAVRVVAVLNDSINDTRATDYKDRAVQPLRITLSKDESLNI